MTLTAALDLARWMATRDSNPDLRHIPSPIVKILSKWKKHHHAKRQVNVKLRRYARIRPRSNGRFTKLYPLATIPAEADT